MLVPQAMAHRAAAASWLDDAAAHAEASTPSAHLFSADFWAAARQPSSRGGSPSAYEAVEAAAAAAAAPPPQAESASSDPAAASPTFALQAACRATAADARAAERVAAFAVAAGPVGAGASSRASERSSARLPPMSEALSEATRRQVNVSDVLRAARKDEPPLPAAADATAATAPTAYHYGSGSRSSSPTAVRSPAHRFSVHEIGRAPHARSGRYDASGFAGSGAALPGVHSEPFVWAAPNLVHSSLLIAPEGRLASGFLDLSRSTAASAASAPYGGLPPPPSGLEHETAPSVQDALLL